HRHLQQLEAPVAAGVLGRHERVLSSLRFAGRCYTHPACREATTHRRPRAGHGCCAAPAGAARAECGSGPAGAPSPPRKPGGRREPGGAHPLSKSPPPRLSLRPQGSPDMIRSILVPLDGSTFGEHALPVALGLARRAGAVLQLAHVHQVVPPATVAGVALMDNLELTMRKEEQAYLDGAARRVDQAGPVRTP